MKWPHTRSDTRLSTDPAEEAGLGLLENLELRFVLGHAEGVECGIFCIVDGSTGRLDPLHGYFLLFLRAFGCVVGGVVRPFDFLRFGSDV